MSTAKRRNLNIGFVSTRLSGTDGVSLETAKWVDVLENMGHTCFYYAGQCDTPPERSMCVAEAFFGQPDVLALHAVAFTKTERPPELTQRIHELRGRLKATLDEFVKRFDLDLLIPENALAIPMNIPLGIALTELITETRIPTIAHHHDFFWERQRFLSNCVWDYLNMSFPPHLPAIRHVVINSSGANQLALRTGISSELIPNIMNFDMPPPPPDAYLDTFRADLGLEPDEKLILQPTRVVARKGIEHAIELVSRLPVKSRLVISHASGDEGDTYEQRVRSYAQMMQVPTIFVADQIGDERGTLPDGRKKYSLGDAYVMCDLVTYPSTIEGFGNAFLEALYYRRPIVVNNYSIFSFDIKPKGFQVIEFDGFITDHTVDRVAELLEHPEQVEQMVEHNFQLGRRYYSYTVLARHLSVLLDEFFGV